MPNMKPIWGSNSIKRLLKSHQNFQVNLAVNTGTARVIWAQGLAILEAHGKQGNKIASADLVP